MLYSENRQFVFVAVPKTGTSTIEAQLRRIDSDLQHNRVRDAEGLWVELQTHATSAQIRATMGARAASFTFVAFLRDPRDVVVSKYYFYRSGRAARKQ
ncbi:MAG: sulfotransferase family 2 domain-containing protein, partial [Pseudomonadales bacterium]